MATASENGAMLNGSSGAPDHHDSMESNGVAVPKNDSLESQTAPTTIKSTNTSVHDNGILVNRDDDVIEVIGHDGWDALGKKLVEARKALDLATKENQAATEAMEMAKKRKDEAARNLRAKTQLVSKLATQFIAWSSGPAARAEAAEGKQTNIMATMPRRNVVSQLPVTEFNPFPTPAASAATSKGIITQHLKTTEQRPESSSGRQQKSSCQTQSLSVKLGQAQPEEKQNRRSPPVDEEEEVPKPRRDENSAKSSKRLKVTAEIGAQESETPSTNSKKKYSYGKSLFRGVRKILSDGSFEARISISGSDLFLGRFKSEEEAARKYDDAARKHRKGQAVLNFVTDEDRALGCRSAFE